MKKRSPCWVLWVGAWPPPSHGCCLAGCETAAEVPSTANGRQVTQGPLEKIPGGGDQDRGAGPTQQCPAHKLPKSGWQTYGLSGLGLLLPDTLGSLLRASHYAGMLECWNSFFELAYELALGWEGPV